MSRQNRNSGLPRTLGEIGRNGWDVIRSPMGSRVLSVAALALAFASYVGFVRHENRETEFTNAGQARSALEAIAGSHNGEIGKGKAGRDIAGALDVLMGSVAEGMVASVEDVPKASGSVEEQIIQLEDGTLRRIVANNDDASFEVSLKSSPDGSPEKIVYRSTVDSGSLNSEHEVTYSFGRGDYTAYDILTDEQLPLGDPGRITVSNDSVRLLHLPFLGHTEADVAAADILDSLSDMQALVGAAGNN